MPGDELVFDLDDPALAAAQRQLLAAEPDNESGGEPASERAHRSASRRGPDTRQTRSTRNDTRPAPAGQASPPASSAAQQTGFSVVDFMALAQAERESSTPQPAPITPEITSFAGEFLRSWNMADQALQPAMAKVLRDQAKDGSRLAAVMEAMRQMNSDVASQVQGYLDSSPATSVGTAVSAAGSSGSEATPTANVPAPSTTATPTAPQSGASVGTTSRNRPHNGQMVGVNYTAVDTPTLLDPGAVVIEGRLASDGTTLFESFPVTGQEWSRAGSLTDVLDEKLRRPSSSESEPVPAGGGSSKIGAWMRRVAAGQ